MLKAKDDWETPAQWCGIFDFSSMSDLLTHPVGDPVVVLGAKAGDDSNFECAPVYFRHKLDADRMLDEANEYLRAAAEGHRPAASTEIPWRPTEAGFGDVTRLDTRLIHELIMASWRSEGSSPAAQRPYRLYAFVVKGPSASEPDEVVADQDPWVMPNDVAVFIRGQSPFRQATSVRKETTYTLKDGELDSVPNVVVLDGQYDVMAYQGQFVALDFNVFDRLIGNPEVREAGTETALTKIAPLFPHDQEALGRASHDPAFQARLREIVRDGNLITKDDLAGLEQIVERYRLEILVDADDHQLRLPPRQSGRWDALRLINDSYVFGALTGREYSADAKKQWHRRVVLGCTSADGVHVDTLRCDDGKTYEGGDVDRDIRSGTMDYVVRRGDHFVQVIRHQLDNEFVLWASDRDTDLTNLLTDPDTFAPVLDTPPPEPSSVPLPVVDPPKRSDHERSDHGDRHHPPNRQR